MKCKDKLYILSTFNALALKMWSFWWYVTFCALVQRLPLQIIWNGQSWQQTTEPAHKISTHTSN